MFNDRFGLTEAVLEGKKTVTRRIVCKPNYDEVFDDSVDRFNKGWIDYIELIDGRQAYTYKAAYKVGEVVAVAQSYYSVMMSRVKVPYKFDINLTSHKGWDNKMFVKAELMPHQVRILSVTAERLQDITYKDCFKEGVSAFTPDYPKDFPVHLTPFIASALLDDTPRDAYATLIDKISGKGTWKSNPWVWRIEFELIK